VDSSTKVTTPLAWSRTVTLPEYVHGSLIGAGRYRTAIGAPTTRFGFSLWP
jgi:hypothetical protein